MKQQEEQLFDFQSKNPKKDYSIKPFRFFKKSLPNHKITSF